MAAYYDLAAEGGAGGARPSRRVHVFCVSGTLLNPCIAAQGIRVAVMDRRDLVSGGLLPGAGMAPAAAPQASSSVEG